MNIGQLRHRVEVQQEIRTSDGMGGFTVEWKKVATYFARVSPMRGEESLIHRQLQDRITHMVVMRWHPLVKASQRLVHNDRVFNIREVLNVDERNIKLELRCEEGAPV